MKTTPLTEKHRALGARMAEFAGYEMPISYAGIREEHLTVRKAVGVFDVSHMGEFIVKGPEALQLVQWVTSNNAAKLKPGQVQYSCLPNEEGGIIDDLLVYRLFDDRCEEGEEAFMLVVNASNIEKDFNWIQKQNRFDTRLIDISERTGLLAVQGPKAAEALQSLTEVALANIPYYHFTKGRFAGIDNVLISATGYTGSGGFELYVENEHLPALWDAVMEAGKAFGIEPAGLGARDTLRLEKGYCLYGHEINDETSPIEAGLGWITKLKKGEFTGKEAILRVKEEGPKRKLIGFKVEGKRVPRQGYTIEDENGNPIGEVTSGTLSPSLNIPIGMGYVPPAFAEAGKRVFVSFGRKRLPAEVVKVPFV
ncbi:MAG TPA: glycine cleavage system aminomethyltransferase GcvT [Phaeodactylibacter sp.]|nr:glycine cleavage system aminomethyltransferase GcvT [Phaeodactylibacter sp.]